MNLCIMPVDPMEDSRRLVDGLLAETKLLLERYGEFLPMGAEIDYEGELIQIPATEGIGETTMLIAELLRQEFARRAEQGDLRASALIQDVVAWENGEERRADAVSIEIEHYTGYNVTMIVPYRRIEGRIVFQAPQIRQGPHRIFAMRMPPVQE